MRRTFTYALLVAAVLAGLVAGSPVLHAQAHRKTSASGKVASGKTNPKTTSKAETKTGLRTGSKAGTRAVSGTAVRRTQRGAGRGSKFRASGRAEIRRAKYTRAGLAVPTAAGALTAGTVAEESYEAGYKNGYDAGLAAVRNQLADEGAGASINTRGQTRDQGPEADRRPGPAAVKAARVPTPEPIETETQETPLLDEVATVHLSGAGMPAPLRGSLASLERQNARLEADGLERILDEADLSSRIENKLLVPLPASAALMVNPNLEENHRYCRTWTARFLADLAKAHEAVFHKPIEVNSAVRTVEYQKRLMNSNGNAAAAEGDIVSPHLTGATIDIAKQGLSRKELAWMRSQLLGLQQAGKIDVEEEFAQACFHITVYKSYTSSLPRHKAGQPATTSQGAGTRRKVEQPDGGETPADTVVGEIPTQGR